jgi:hypothetical protein
VSDKEIFNLNFQDELKDGIRVLVDPPDDVEPDYCVVVSVSAKEESFLPLNTVEINMDKQAAVSMAKSILGELNHGWFHMYHVESPAVVFPVTGDEDLDQLMSLSYKSDYSKDLLVVSMPKKDGLVMAKSIIKELEGDQENL